MYTPSTVAANVSPSVNMNASTFGTLGFDVVHTTLAERGSVSVESETAAREEADADADGVQG